MCHDLGNYICSKELIGQGSFSKVYMGLDKISKMKVAIKKIKKQKIKSNICKIYKEIEILQTLNHINIVKFLDCVETEKYIFIITEYCNTCTLIQYISTLKSDLSESQIFYFLNQIKNGLQYLKQYNIMHRDLKPENILLTIPDQEDKTFKNCIVKIADFGSANYFTDDEVINTLCGTPYYLAPEIIKFESYTTKADLWSVGMIFYQLVFRKSIFSKTEMSLLYAQQTMISMPQNIQSPELNSLLSNLLMLDPQNRLSWAEFFDHTWFINSDTNINTNAEELNQYIFKNTDEINNQKYIMSVLNYENLVLDVLPDEINDIYLQSLCIEHENHIKFPEKINEWTCKFYKSIHVDDNYFF
jgi:serine/threonine-protein kinase ULK/ATG1